MSNLNNYAFSNLLTTFNATEIDRLQKQVDDAWKILSDVNYQWKDEEQKKAGQVRFNNMKARLEWLNKFNDEGQRLCNQHETLVNKLCKLYERWWNEVSNEGKQEREIMSMQADALQDIFVEIWKELKPLDLNLPMPNGLNL
ncbi:MAG: hypothetical protein LLG05_05205 [Porphyromonadaceae bacterium]|nr:hypothetical protein [Porphyromonadaceae bacterium]